MNSDTKLNNFQFKPYSVLYEQLIIRCRTLYLFVILLAFVHISIHPLPALRRVRNSYTNKIKELDNDEKDLFFVSAYYYGVGYSLYKNQVTLTFIAPRDAHWERRKIIAIRSDDTKTVLEPLQIHRATPHNLCKYVTLVGTIVLEEELTELELLVNGHTAKIRYLPADNKPKDLVVCTPPIYNNVRWQNVLLAAHVYTSFGGHLQTYVATTSRPFFEFLEELKRLKGISVDSFPDFYGKSKLDGIEFGGVTVANSDCLNKYKSSGSFITFLEWSDLLVPKSFDSYFSEFANYYESEIFVGLLEYRNERGVAKVVTRPSLIDSVWLNEPVEHPYKLKSKQMDDSKIFEIPDSADVDSMIRGNFTGGEALKSADRVTIGMSIRKTITNPSITAILGRLREDHSTIRCSKSFTTYYTDSNSLNCPGAHLCRNKATKYKFSCVKSDLQFKLLKYNTNFYQLSSSKGFEKTFC